MTINQIKEEISQKTGATILALNMATQFEADGVKPTDWVSHWDNDKRLRIVMHKDLFTTIASNPAMSTLAYKSELVHDKNYTRYVVINPKNVVGTL